MRITLGAQAAGPFVVAVGADHGGFALKEEIKVHLTRLGLPLPRPGDVLDGGRSTIPTWRSRWPGQCAPARRAWASSWTAPGIGSAMAANKVRGIRAAPCTDADAAKNAREHNDANVLTLGARFVDVPRMRAIVETFLTTECTEERHRRRVRKIEGIEESPGR